MPFGLGLGLGIGATTFPGVSTGDAAVTLDDTTIAAAGVAPATGALAQTVDNVTVAGVIRPFDPTTLVLSAYWRPGFAVPWLATATAGVSGTTGSLVTNASDPTAGTVLNGYTPGQFTAASSRNLKNATAITTVATVGAGTIFCLFYADSATADTSTNGGIDNPQFITDSNYDCCLGFSDGGVSATAYSSGYKRRQVAAATGAWHLAIMRWDSTSLLLKVDSATEATVACPALTIMTGSLQVGRGHNPGTGIPYFDGRIMELGMAAYKMTDAESLSLKQYINSTYALAL